MKRLQVEVTFFGDARRNEPCLQIDPSCNEEINAIEPMPQVLNTCRSHKPIHHAQVKSNAANIQPAFNHESRTRFDAMMISPTVDSMCVTAAAYTNENRIRMKSNACMAKLSDRVWEREKG